MREEFEYKLPNKNNEADIYKTNNNSLILISANRSRKNNRFYLVYKLQA